MSEKRTAPYGSWKSPLTAGVITRHAIALGQIAVNRETVYWLEGRPLEGGRNVLVRRDADGNRTDLTPDGFDVRSRVHEYGGGAFWLDGATVYFVNLSDQRIYRQRAGAAPAPLVPADTAFRYADGVVDRARERIVCVREDHGAADRQPQNALVTVSLGGDDAGGDLLVMGNDFYASPRLSPDGRRLAWLTWNHPNMPWDGTELWVGDLDNDDKITAQSLVAGGMAESIFQPEWSPAGDLYYISDRTGWWNLYHWQSGQNGPLYERAAEFGQPQWEFGMSTYGFAKDGRLACLFSEEGISHMGLLNPRTGALTIVELAYTDLHDIRVGDDFAVLVAGSPTEMPAIIRVDLESSAATVLRHSGRLPVDRTYFSRPQAITFSTTDEELAHAFYFAPANPDFEAQADEKPPLLVISHGGPTGATSSTLNPGVQYWTSRGFAVLDVNYRGSTGYGRPYRKKLYGRWGIVDVVDCVQGARYLVERGYVDGERLAIRGASAGGYTTLCALTFHDLFGAGASYFGVSDLEQLARETHKFESHYLDKLVGPYPQEKVRYEERSPLHHAERLACPVIFFQGMEDAVVPPNQAERMVAVLRDKGLPVAYVTFPHEQHGFRRAENIRRSLEAELYFYGQIFAFRPHGNVEPVHIHNM